MIFIIYIFLLSSFIILFFCPFYFHLFHIFMTYLLSYIIIFISYYFLLFFTLFILDILASSFLLPPIFHSSLLSPSSSSSCSFCFIIFFAIRFVTLHFIFLQISSSLPSFIISPSSPILFIHSSLFISLHYSFSFHYWADISCYYLRHCLHFLPHHSLYSLLFYSIIIFFSLYSSSSYIVSLCPIFIFIFLII